MKIGEFQKTVKLKKHITQPSNDKKLCGNKRKESFEEALFQPEYLKDTPTCIRFRKVFHLFACGVQISRF